MKTDWLTKYSNPYLPINGAGVGVCVLITLGAYLLGIAPVMSLSQEAQDQTDKLHAREVEITQLVQTRRDRAKEADNLRELLTRQSLRLVTLDRLNERLGELTHLAGQTHLQINEIRPGEAVQSSPYYRSLPIHISGTGTHQAAMVFLHKLNEAFPDIKVKSFTFVAQSGQNATGVQASFGLTLFIAPDRS